MGDLIAGCTRAGCENPHDSRGLCHKHYQRAARHGTLPPKKAPPTTEERFWSKVDVGHPLGCWHWTGGCDPKGYGSFSLSKKQGQVSAHRFAYELLRGPINEQMTLDHLCRNRPCVNPDHLEEVTVIENIRRGFGMSVRLAQRTHCNYGHRYTPENTQFYGKGWRRCRACARAKRAAR